MFATTIGELFFPTHDPIVQTIFAFSIFALGFMMRPIGGAVFGHIGDRFGRRLALAISILGMAAATFCISILPAYNKIGVLAPLLLVLIRLFQGLCIGGEGAGSAVFILEHLENYRPGLIGSIIMASNILGTLCAITVGIILHAIYGADETSWRYGFMLGGIVGLTGLYLRHGLEETPTFHVLKQSSTIMKLPVLQVLHYKWRRLIVVACLAGLASTTSYIIRAYLNVFFVQFMQYSIDEALYLTALCLINFIVALPIFGLMADRIGYHTFLNRACFAIIVLVIPVFRLLTDAEHNLILVVTGIFLMGILAAAISAPAYPYAIQTFSPELRYSGVALSWNIGNALFGGTAPTIATFFANTISFDAPAYYIIAVALLVLISRRFKKSEKY